MPNHFHGIISFVDTNNVGAIHELPEDELPKGESLIGQIGGNGVGAIHELPNNQPGDIAELTNCLADATFVKGNSSGRVINERANRERAINARANHARAIRELPLRPDQPAVNGPRRKMLLPKVVGYFKMNTAKRINLMRNTPGVPVWQRNYYERVIRNQEELELARKYIFENPIKWEMDKANPANMPVIPLTPNCPIIKSGATTVGAIHELPKEELPIL
jgi:REP element-mobilizing transposase RayT